MAEYFIKISLIDVVNDYGSFFGRFTDELNKIEIVVIVYTSYVVKNASMRIILFIRKIFAFL